MAVPPLNVRSSLLQIPSAKTNGVDKSSVPPESVDQKRRCPAPSPPHTAICHPPFVLLQLITPVPFLLHPPGRTKNNRRNPPPGGGTPSEKSWGMMIPPLHRLPPALFWPAAKPPGRERVPACPWIFKPPKTPPPFSSMRHSPVSEIDSAGRAF